MISLPHFKHGTSHKSNHHKSAGFKLFARIGRDPYADWPIIFVCTFILAFALVMMSAKLYADVNAISMAPPRPPAAPPATDTNDLKRVLDAFAAKALKHDNLTHGYSGVTDPSL